MGEFVFVTFGQEANVMNTAQALDHEKLNLVYSVIDCSKITKEHVKNLKKCFSGELKFYLAVKEAKHVKKEVFDGFLQLGTSKETVFRGVNYVYNNENEKEKDFIHQRRSGLNHIILRDFAQKGIGVLFSYSELQNADNKRKAQLLGRILQNVKLCKKYGVVCSFACLGNFDSLRSRYDIEALQRICE